MKDEEHQKIFNKTFLMFALPTCVHLNVIYVKLLPEFISKNDNGLTNVIIESF